MRDRQLLFIAPPALPLQDHADLPGIPVGAQDHFIQQAGEQTLAVPRRGPLSLPQRQQTPTQRRKPCRIRRRRLFRLGELKPLLRAFQRSQRMFPVSFQRRRNQPVVGINLTIAPLGKGGVVAAPAPAQGDDCAAPPLSRILPSARPAVPPPTPAGPTASRKHCETNRSIRTPPTEKQLS